MTWRLIVVLACAVLTAGIVALSLARSFGATLRFKRRRVFAWSTAKNASDFIASVWRVDHVYTCDVVLPAGPGA